MIACYTHRGSVYDPLGSYIAVTTCRHLTIPVNSNNTHIIKSSGYNLVPTNDNFSKYSCSAFCLAHCKINNKLCLQTKQLAHKSYRIYHPRLVQKTRNWCLFFFFAVFRLIFIIVCLLYKPICYIHFKSRSAYVCPLQYMSYDMFVLCNTCHMFVLCNTYHVICLSFPIHVIYVYPLHAKHVIC